MQKKIIFRSKVTSLKRFDKLECSLPTCEGRFLWTFFIKENILTEQAVVMIVCRQRHFIYKRLVNK